MRRIPDADRFRSDDYRTIIRIFGCNQEITDANILENTFSYDSTMLESGGFQIGTAMADEIKFTLDNSEGIYGKRFIDEEFEVYLAAIPTDGSREDAEWFLLGSYICKTIDETFTNKCAVVLQDRLTLMDKKASLTTGTLYSNLVSVCDGIVQLKLTSEEQTFLSDIPIYPENAEVNMTVRDFVRGCALLMWENAYITPDGFLSFRVCENSSLGFTPSDRFSSELGEEHFIGPIEILDDEGVLIYTAGTEIGQRITFTSSSSPIIPLIGGIENLALAYNEEVVPGRRIVDFGYYPLTMTLMQTWEVCPGDVITYADKNGNLFTSLVTSTASVLNGATSVTSDASETDETAKNTDSVRTLVQNLSTGISEAQDTADEAMPKYGSCDTPSTTAAKVVKNVTDFVLKQGTRIAVLMSSANTVTSPTLNVNSTGAKPIVTADGGTLPLLTTNSTARGWLANSLVTFVYDGTNWRIDDNVAMTRINHILTEQIAGTNGWINLKDGTFNYGSGKLVWNGSQLTVDGKVTAKTGNIGGWDIGTYILSNSTTIGGAEYLAFMQSTDGVNRVNAFGVRKTKGSTVTYPFRVTYGGKLHSEAGDIGGWTIGEDQLSSSAVVGGSTFTAFMKALSNNYYETAFGIKKDSGTAFSVDYAGNLFAARVKTLYLAPSNSSLIVMEGLQPYAYDLYMTSEQVSTLDTKFGLTTGRPKLYDFLNNSQRILSIPYADGEVAQVPPGTTHRNLLTTALTLEANHRYVINYVVQWGANASGRRATAISIDGSSVGIIATDHRDAMSSGVTFCRGEYWIPASSSSRTLQITGWQDGTSGQTLPATVRYQLVDLGV